MESRVPVEQRLLRLFDHLGLPSVHVAAQGPYVVARLLEARPGGVASATLLCPGGFDPLPFGRLGERLLVFQPAGEGNTVLADGTPPKRTADTLPEATTVVLPNYAPMVWSDITWERESEIRSALEPFLARATEQTGAATVNLSDREGEVDGVTYRVRGSGSPLVLFPFGLAPSQWEPLIPALSERYCTITVGGAHLGAVAILEERGHAGGYRNVVASVWDRMGVAAGQSVLEVGCGSGVLCRWLAERTGGANAIVGVDISPYLLREAAALAERDGFSRQIDFRQGNAEALPFETGQFDATFSSTVMEEVNADRMMAELVRVTKPGGNVGVVVRAVDLPPRSFFNVPLRPELKAKLEPIGPGMGPSGCADASLYQRCYDAGLRDLVGWPQYATFYPGRDVFAWWTGAEADAAASLEGDEVREWRAAVAQAQAQGTLQWTWAHHCAVGTKPRRT